MHMLFFKKVFKILRKSTKHPNFWLGMQHPFNVAVNFVLQKLSMHFNPRLTKLFLIIRLTRGLLQPMNLKNNNNKNNDKKKKKN